MEILSKNGGEEQTPNQPTQQKNKNASRTSVFVGVLLIILGGLWMMTNLNVLPTRIFDVVFSWQMLIIVLGLYLVVVRNYWVGGSLMAVGTLFLLTDYLHIHIPVVEIFLPAVVIAMGVGMILSRGK
ncbi:MAG: hypothetical protein J6Q40_00970 [Tidjanibacter sp.]|nr:hypothetical protein [Tidjanibacter sp.]